MPTEINYKENDLERFGETHDLRCIFTQAVADSDPNKKFSKWMCVNCRMDFSHFYGLQPNIFKAMKTAGISHVCPAALPKEKLSC